ncbi:MAG: BolA/IbaG family iron-sulfur metabolism protein [Halieaceae bacterium]|jgi:monothiol glutaredoxin|nr:BolA/IbaG family iron-sulfur metabolism protein [Halieaceae bacterium]
MVSSTFTAQDAQAEVIVDGAGAKYDITVVSDLFSDQRPVKRQQSVYAALRDAIADGRIHAVNIHAFTRDEWSSRSA